ncbi:hypothetical protein C2I36_03340 [Rhodobacteraceae bacterium WD3A24]|nr:hypothetical protein C2I36_03340 [Rhodobacteraceae bacterium WD3A24]
MHFRVLVAAALTAATWAGAAFAQASAAVPAEVPPESFRNTQYVDSEGCAFIRAGFDGRVTWVPRLDRERNHVCGLEPSLPQLAETQEEPAAQPQATTEAQPLAADPAPERSAPEEAEPRRARRTEARPRQAEPTATAAREPARQAVAQQRAQQAPAGHNRACPQRLPYGQELRLTDGRTVIRCTAQPARLNLDRGAPVEPAAPSGRQSRPAAVQPPATPEGYRPVWEDDRLNPRRAQGRPEGEAAMRRVWSESIPREQIGQPAPRSAAAPADARPEVSPRDRLVPTPDAYISTMGRTGADRPAGRFVQVGTFAVESNAGNTARRLRAAGLTVQTREVRSGGRSLRVVLAGPFSDPEALRDALARARGMGFYDAFTRG